MVIPVPHGSVLHISLTNHFLAATTELEQCKKSYLLAREKRRKHFWKSRQKYGPTAGGKKKTKRAEGLDRITREPIEKWNLMTALTFQTLTVQRHQTFPEFLQGHVHNKAPPYLYFKK